MILISHRGNINGRSFKDENQPTYIDTAISAGYDVEIDIWYEVESGKLYLGHDTADYQIDIDWLDERREKLWIHCKNMDALSYFNKIHLQIGSEYNYFSHDKDIGVLTSYGYIWSTNSYDNGILVLPEVFKKTPIDTTIGICSDIIQNYKK
jgi:hypothetical protein|tara:strand:- start:382 stop:834 length:453 start_codon:yes stop_codon:yes gene_type:complete